MSMHLRVVKQILWDDGAYDLAGSFTQAMLPEFPTIDRHARSALKVLRHKHRAIWEAVWYETHDERLADRVLERFKDATSKT